MLKLEWKTTTFLLPKFLNIRRNYISVHFFYWTPPHRYIKTREARFFGPSLSILPPQYFAEGHLGQHFRDMHLIRVRCNPICSRPVASVHSMSLFILSVQLLLTFSYLSFHGHHSLGAFATHRTPSVLIRSFHDFYPRARPQSRLLYDSEDPLLKASQVKPLKYNRSK